MACRSSLSIARSVTRYADHRCVRHTTVRPSGTVSGVSRITAFHN